MIICALLLTMSAHAQENNYTVSGDLSPFVGVVVNDLADIDSVFIVNLLHRARGQGSVLRVEDTPSQQRANRHCLLVVHS